jgi:hypothetical protein
LVYAYEFGMYNWTGCEKFYMGFMRFKVNVCSWFYVTGCISIFPAYIFLCQWRELLLYEGAVDVQGSCFYARELLLCERAVAVQESVCCVRERVQRKGAVAAQGSCCYARKLLLGSLSWDGKHVYKYVKHENVTASTGNRRMQPPA